MISGPFFEKELSSELINWKILFLLTLEEYNGLLSLSLDINKLLSNIGILSILFSVSFISELSTI